MLRLLVFLFLAFAWTPCVRAHDLGLSQAHARLSEDDLRLSIAYDLEDIRRLVPKSAILGTDTSPLTIQNARADLEHLAARLVEVGVNGVRLEIAQLSIVFNASDHLEFSYLFPHPDSIDVTFHFPRLADLPANHREHFTLTDAEGRVRTEKMLSGRTPRITVPIYALPPAPAEKPASASPAVVAAEDTPNAGVAPPAAGFGAFFVLGVEHIWTGYDHLLFLFGLLLVCVSFRAIVVIITCFTVAHSVTLILAALDVVALPSALVEAAIAASIVFVGVENLARRGAASRWRPALTIFFGLVHGFGFAGVLRDLGLGASEGGLAVPLFAFNLGVEVGQLVIAALVLPLLWRLRRNPRFTRVGVPALSLLIACAGLYWLLERTLFG